MTESLAEPRRSASRAISSADTVDLEHDTAGLDLACPVFDRTLALTHTNFGRLCRDRNVREDADPDAAGALHVTRDRAASRFDLARIHAVGFLGLQPNSPKARSKPPLATPLMRPLNCLRYFVRFGCNIFYSPNLSVASANQAFSRRRSPVLPPWLSPSIARRSEAIGSCSRISPLKIQTLMPQMPIGGVRFGRAVVDVGAQRVQRHAAFAIPFRTRDFGTAETAGAGDLDAFGAKTHGGLDGALHGAAERDTALELLGDRLSDERRVDFRLANFNDVEVRFGLRHRRISLRRSFSMSAPFLPMIRPGRAEWIVTRHFLCGRSMTTLEMPACFSSFIRYCADLQVLVQQLAVFGVVGEPAASPRYG